MSENLEPSFVLVERCGGGRVGLWQLEKPFVLWNKLIIIVIIIEAVVLVIVEGVGGVDQLGGGGGHHGVGPVILLAGSWLSCGLLEFLRWFSLSLPWSDAWGFCKWLRGRGIHKRCKTRARFLVFFLLFILVLVVLSGFQCCWALDVFVIIEP